MVAKRLGWILLGVIIGIGGTMGRRVAAQDRIGTAVPVTIRFIGVLEQGTNKVAIFSDDKRQPFYASEGQTVLGQYKLLKIGMDSVTISDVNGGGVQTISMARNRRGSNMAPPAGAQPRPVENEVLTDHPAAGSTTWKFVSDSKTHSCWLAATIPTGREVTALAPAPPEACQ